MTTRLHALDGSALADATAERVRRNHSECIRELQRLVLALVDVFTATKNGLAPASGGGTANFLRADGEWETPPGTGFIPDGDKGDITTSGGGASWAIDSNAVTDAKLRDSTATSVIGRSSGTSGDPGDIATTTDGDVLRRAAGALGFGAIPESSVTSLVSDLAGKSSTSHDHTTGALVPEAGLDVFNAPADRNLLTWSAGDAKLKWATSTEYAATSLSVVVGTILLGNVDSLDIKNDADYLEVQEVSGVPGHDTRVTFNNVATFNKVRLRVFATEGSSHLQELRIYNVGTTVFDLFTTWATQLGFTDIAVAVDNGADYIDTGNSNRVIVQIYHPLSGVGSHRMRCDFMVVVDDLTGGGGITHHQGLDGLQDPNAHPATAVSNEPAGTIAATTVQAAIDELDAEKVPTTRTISTSAPMTGGGDLSANRTLDFPNFIASGASHARGAVPDPGASAGTTKFLREDATWQVPAGGGGSGASIRSAVVNVPTAVTDTVLTVTDAAVTNTMLIAPGWGAVLDTDENTPDEDVISMSAVAGTGQFSLRLAGPLPFRGDFKINYLVA